VDGQVSQDLELLELSSSQNSEGPLNSIREGDFIMRRLAMILTFVIGTLTVPSVPQASAQVEAPYQIKIPSRVEPAAATSFSKLTNSKNKLGSLRMFMASRQGKTEITSCPGMSGTPPLPTPQEFGQYYGPFGASFNVAASFGDAGAGGIPSAQNSIQTEALGQFQYESPHFFYDYTKCLSKKPTLSFGGTVGLEPALVMENLSSQTETIANPNNRPMFQDSFGWSLGPKMNIATTQMSQFAAFATLGEKYLVSQVSSFKQGDNTVVATPVSNNVGQSAIYWETGIEWKYLNTDIANAYLNKTDVMSPPFSISVGYKHDNRFNGTGDLAGFSNPESRLFFRFNVGLNKIGNWSGEQVDPGKGYTFKFGVDYERPLGDSRMPTATLYYVSASLDIMKIFKPSTPQ
jgi:hypothetical protein